MNGTGPNSNSAPAAAADPRVQAAAELAAELHAGHAPTHPAPEGAAASPLSDFAFGAVLDKLKGVGVEELQAFILYVQGRISARIGGG